MSWIWGTIFNVLLYTTVTPLGYIFGNSILKALKKALKRLKRMLKPLRRKFQCLGRRGFSIVFRRVLSFSRRFMLIHEILRNPWGAYAHKIPKSPKSRISLELEGASMVPKVNMKHGNKSIRYTRRCRGSAFICTDEIGPYFPTLARNLRKQFVW